MPRQPAAGPCPRGRPPSPLSTYTAAGVTRRRPPPPGGGWQWRGLPPARERGGRGGGARRRRRLPHQARHCQQTLAGRGGPPHLPRPPSWAPVWGCSGTTQLRGGAGGGQGSRPEPPCGGRVVGGPAWRRAHCRRSTRWRVESLFQKIITNTGARILLTPYKKQMPMEAYFKPFFARKWGGDALSRRHSARLGRFSASFSLDTGPTGGLLPPVDG